MLEDYQKIEKVIFYLEKHFKDQPSLEDLANLIHLSPFHFQRLFKRWVGISPKKFLQFLTIGYAKKLLDESHDLLRTSYDSGLSGPGRLHDLFINIESVTPGEYKSKGKGIQISYGYHPSFFGLCFLAITHRGICGLSFHNSNDDTAGLKLLKKNWPEAKIEYHPDETEKLFNKIFPKKREQQSSPINLLLKGTNFQIKVWEALLQIPEGFLFSYQDIAKLIQQPKALRAVGNAIGNNPIAYIIPCHRVIKKMGNFGEYHWGSVRKKMIIGWEAGKRYQNSQTR